MKRLLQNKHQKTALWIAGALASLGFAPVYAWPLFFGGLLFAWKVCETKETYASAALTGYLFGFGFFCAGFYWIGNALLVDVLTFGWLYPIVLLASGAFFGLFFIVPFMIWHAFKTMGVWAKVLGFASAFVLMEYVRSFFLTGFPWNMLGTMFAFSDVLVQTASLVGTYGLGFLLVLWVGCCYAALEKRYKSAALVFLCSFAFVIQFGAWRMSFEEHVDSDLKIRLVQPSIKQNIKWSKEALEDNVKQYIDMSRSGGFSDVKLVVWGETATAFNPSESKYWQRKIKKAVPPKGYLITGLLRYDRLTDELFNSMSVIDDEGQTVAFYDKNHLVPFGEYIPFRTLLPGWVRPVANQIADFSKGEKYKLLDVEGLPKTTGLICYEIIFEDEVINRKNKPELIVLVSNDGWYGNSSGPYQHLVSARMRAVEEGVTIVRAANNGISAVINPLGQIVSKIDLNEKGISDVYLPKKLTLPTLYSKIGGKSIQWVMCLLLAVLFLLKNTAGKA